ncbi:hypothetical protein [Falsiroseomonas bella]|uniref:hypothetical protein n=1 Tax=Falsiroseomonas bella TaxID=2184016 RepID=UPI0013049D98|nr:hypothetical protein [Falsiroseomonas bella]
MSDNMNAGWRVAATELRAEGEAFARHVALHASEAETPARPDEGQRTALVHRLRRKVAEGRAMTLADLRLKARAILADMPAPDVLAPEAEAAWSLARDLAALPDA